MKQILKAESKFSQPARGAMRNKSNVVKASGTKGLPHRMNCKDTMMGDVYVAAIRTQDMSRVRNPANYKSARFQSFLNSTQEAKALLVRLDVLDYVDAKYSPEH